MNVQRLGISSGAKIQGLCPSPPGLVPPLTPIPQSTPLHTHHVLSRAFRYMQQGATEPALCRVMCSGLCLPSSAVPVCFSQGADVETAVLQAPLSALGLNPASSSQGHAEDQLAQPMLPPEQGWEHPKLNLVLMYIIFMPAEASQINIR